MAEQGRLELGFFTGWGDVGDVVLISGLGEPMAELAAILRGLNDPESTSVLLHTLPFLAVHGGVHVAALPCGLPECVRCVGNRAAGAEFEWRMSDDGWLEVADKIDRVARSDGPCHAYLDTQSGCDDACVMVSKGEYSQDWWSEHAGPVTETSRTRNEA